jgi:hypothetical protein
MRRKLRNPKERTVKWLNSSGKSWTLAQPSWQNFVNTRGCQNESTVMWVLHNFNYWSSLQNCHFNCFNICWITILIAFRLHTSLEFQVLHYLIHIILSEGTYISSSKIRNTTNIIKLRKASYYCWSLPCIYHHCYYFTRSLVRIFTPKSYCVRRFRGYSAIEYLDIFSHVLHSLSFIILTCGD